MPLKLRINEFWRFWRASNMSVLCVTRLITVQDIDIWFTRHNVSMLEDWLFLSWYYVWQPCLSVSLLNLSVCLSVCNAHAPCKKGWMDRGPIGDGDSWWPMKYYARWRPDPPTAKREGEWGNFFPLFTTSKYTTVPTRSSDVATFDATTAKWL